MPYDDIRGSHWDEPDEEDDEGSLGFAGGMALFDFSAFGECRGCRIFGNVNGYQFCELCMDDFDEE